MSSAESAKHLLDKYSLHILVVVSMALGNFVWNDIKDTLKTVQLIQFQQIKDGKDIEQQGREIERLNIRVDRLEAPKRGKINEVSNGFYRIGGP